MILDAKLTFSGSGNGTSGGITSGSWTDAPTTGTQDSTNIIDLGEVLGIPSYADGGGARDISVGYPLWLSVLVTALFAGGTSLQLTLAGAPDNGSGSPGSYTTMWTSPAYAEADLVAGVQLANIMVPRPVPDQPYPRFLKMTYVTVGTHTGGGSVEAQIVLDRDNQVLGTDDRYSGYRAGLNVAN